MLLTISHRLLVASAIALPFLAVVPEAWARTRYFSTMVAREYVTTTYTVTEANVYPAVTAYVPNIVGNGSNCSWKTQAGGTFGLSKLLVLRTYSGAPYSFRSGEPKPSWQIGLDLAVSHKGAGNSCYLQNWKPLDVFGWITGIDCSQLLSASWGIYPRIVTRDIAAQCNPTSLAAPGVRYGDAFLASGHVRIFAEGVRDDGSVGCYEANANPNFGRCTFLVYNFEEQRQKGYRALRFRKFQDSPAADVVGLRVARGSAGATLNWMSLSESEVDAFLVRRGANREGPFDVLVAEVAPTATSGGSGSYEVADPGAPAGGAFYRLDERETTGAVIPRGTVYLAPGQQQNARISEVGR